jgi:hypothetical protein
MPAIEEEFISSPSLIEVFVKDEPLCLFMGLRDKGHGGRGGKVGRVRMGGRGRKPEGQCKFLSV